MRAVLRREFLLHLWTESMRELLFHLWLVESGRELLVYLLLHFELDGNFLSSCLFFVGAGAFGSFVSWFRG